MRPDEKAPGSKHPNLRRRRVGDDQNKRARRSLILDSDIDSPASCRVKG